jgi:predicted acyltransferase
MSLLTGQQVSNRLRSLDFLRGLIMVLLAFESTGLYEHLYVSTNGSFTQGLVRHFFHHPWNGLRFWDLVQPSFMFMSGTALAFSLYSQELKGIPWIDSFKKACKRSAWLFFWGVLNYAVHPDGLQLELSNVLTQLAFTTLIAFLIFRWSTGAQILFCVFILLLTESLYRFTHIPGFDQPFVNQHNFGNYMELKLTGKINPEGWVSINWIPTTVHTVAGALAGKLLLTGKGKIKTLLVWGLICWILGFGLDFFHITPIIKRIATSSFTLASLGFCLWFLAIAYGWIDLLGHKKYLRFFLVVGMNSIFIYLFFEIVGSRWFNGYVGDITNGLLTMISVPGAARDIISSLCIFALEWELCYFLYRKKIFFKI